MPPVPRRPAKSASLTDESPDAAPPGDVAPDAADLPDGPAAALEELDAADADESALESADESPPDAADADAPADAGVDLAAVEALLFSTHSPLTPARIADVLELPVSKGVKRAVAALNKQYAEAGRSFRVEQVAGGYQMLTLPQYGPLLQKLHAREADAKLTKAAQETLAVIAYKQPVLRTDVEAIRGVSCGETIRSLMEKRLVKIAGRADLPGRPILYGTTRRFLESFGLNSLKDLPQPEGSGRRAEAAGE